MVTFSESEINTQYAKHTGFFRKLEDKILEKWSSFLARTFHELAAVRIFFHLISFSHQLHESLLDFTEAKTKRGGYCQRQELSHHLPQWWPTETAQCVPEAGLHSAISISRALGVSSVKKPKRPTAFYLLPSARLERARPLVFN